ncbi:ribonucleoside-diphosphate reductase subunit alpha [Candidatus Uhrbacteria bacterium]|nr:ribonucleoside-diphosphate reductase subunit alpha [Candidatus Uhrbacteria bacterium]
MPLSKIKKRNGSVVDFDRNRIEIAIQKAFEAQNVRIHEGFFAEVANDVHANLEQTFVDRIPSVEDVQDRVEKIIAQNGYFEVARAYIIYRYEHTKQREKKQQEFIEKIEKNALFVVKRSGSREKFSLEQIKKCLSRFTKGFEDIVDVETIALQCRNELYDGITTKDIFHALVMTTRSMIEQDPGYSTVAVRLLFHGLYREAIGEDVFDATKLDQQYREAFVRNIRKGVEIGRLEPRMLTYDLDALSKILKPERDDLFKFLGGQVLYDRYFLHDPYDNGRVLETPQAFWLRIAMGLALREAKKTEYVKEFYEVVSTLRYVPSTPTLFHAGAEVPQLASCYLNTVSDSLDHIFKVIGDNAQMSKWSGGIGTDWTNVRGTGSLIKGVGVESQGVVPFLKVANDTTHAINRSGRRRGAACVYLETWHYDIEDFLELRKNTGDERRRTHDMNTANWIPDLFMKRVRDDADWTLFSPHEVPDLHDIYGKKFEERYVHCEKLASTGKIKMVKVLRARDLWKKMLAMLFETGHPWITFKDPCNVRSPQDHVGVVHNSNLCTEITLNNSEDETAVCNLGSINLGRHMKSGQLDVELLKSTIITGMRMLDNVIDLNFYPTKETQTSNLRHRPVGLGIMGFQDALYMMNYRFDSDETVRFADESMEIISYYAIIASTELARERGPYPTFSGSKWDRGLLPIDTLDLLEKERGEKVEVARSSRLDWNVVRANIKKYGMRNSNCLAMAPTATIGNISGAIPTIEPIYKNIYVKSNMSGDFVVINSYLVEDLKKLKLWDFEMLGKIKYHDGSIRDIPEIPGILKEKYKEVFEIEPEWMVKVAAHRGKWIDQSQSFNIFFRGSSGKVLNDVYFLAWSMGLKTTYYLRTLAASQVEKSTVNTSEFGSTHNRKDSVVKTATVQERQTTGISVSAFTGKSTVASVGAAAAPQMYADTPQAVTELKLCKIEDPDCESCQ